MFIAVIKPLLNIKDEFKIRRPTLQFKSRHSLIYNQYNMINFSFSCIIIHFLPLYFGFVLFIMSFEILIGPPLNHSWKIADIYMYMILGPSVFTFLCLSVCLFTLCTLQFLTNKFAIPY